MEGPMRLPLARSEALIIEELGDELLVYDVDVKRAHCLAPTAARVWRRCDGLTSWDALASDLALTHEEITRALDELAQCGLLAPSPVLTNDGLSRRELGLKVTKVAAGAAVVPLILSIAAPAAAATTSQVAACRALAPKANTCGACNAGGSPTNCCCCHYAPGKKFCAGDNAECLATGPTLDGFDPQQLNCTEDPGDI